jgi:SNF2 family DNA or RNA helicase
MPIRRIRKERRPEPLWAGLTYFEHQLAGIKKMLALERIGTLYPTFGPEPEGKVYGGLQCDDMGLGKTIQILATMKTNPKPKTLLLCPVALVDNWTENGLKAGFRVFVKGPDNWDELDSEVDSGPMLYVTNYETILSFYELLDEVWDRIVLDEAHAIRSFKSKKTELLMYLSQKIPIKWAVTGTPIVNTQKDAVTLFAFLGVPTTDAMAWIPAYYEPLVNEMCIHRSMDEMRSVLTSCPPVPIIEKRIIEFKDAKEEAFYREIQGLKSDYDFAYKVSEYELVLTILLRLKQSSLSPKLLDPDWKNSSAKMDALKELVDAEPDHKFIVFCSFQEEMELLAKFLDTGCELYHGGLNGTQRRNVLIRAKEESCQVLLIQLQSGGVGLNLQEFTRVIFMSPWWTSALMDQAIARAVRMGQKEVVKVTHLLLKEEDTLNIKNIDTMANEAAETKRKMLVKFFDHRALV